MGTRSNPIVAANIFHDALDDMDLHSALFECSFVVRLPANMESVIFLFSPSACKQAVDLVRYLFIRFHGKVVADIRKAVDYWVACLVTPMSCKS